MPATSAWLASLEASLNRSIGQSAKAAAAARRLNGTALKIEAGGVLAVRAAVSAERLALSAASAADGDENAVISGSPLALLDLLLGAAARGARQAANIRGDAEIANRYREFFVLARPDLEEELSRFIGDVPARRLSQAARGALAWARKAHRTARENVAEYLTEESRDLVARAELEEFLEGVDRLRESADRVEARLARLEARLRGAS